MIALALPIVFMIAGVATHAAKPPATLEEQALANEREWSLASYTLAVELYVRAADSWTEAGEFRKAADTLRNAASISLKLRDFDKTRSLLDRAIGFERRSNYREGEIASLSLSCELEILAGNMRSAAAIVKTVNDIRLAVPHAEAEAARSYANAELAYSKFDLNETILYATKARELWIQSGNVERRMQANSMIAYARAALYEPLEAEKLADESLALAEQTGNQRAKATVLGQKSFVALLVNEPLRALRICQEAESMFPADMDFGEQAQLANGIGGIYSLMGEWRTSHAYALKAYELFGKDRSTKGQLATLVSLIEGSFELGDGEQAFEYYAEAQALANRLGNDYFLAIADRFVANHHLRTGEADKAIPYYEKSLKRLNDAGFKSGISAIRSNLGEAYLRTGDLASARRHFEAAHEINSSVSDRFAEAQTVYDLARLTKAEGDLAAADVLISQSIELTEKLRDKVSNQKLRSEYFATALERYAFAIEGLVRRGDAAGSLRLAEQGRARETIENLSVMHAGIFADADQETVDRERSIRITLSARADKLTDLLRGGLEDEARKIGREINELQNQLEAIKADLKLKSPLYSAIKDPPPFDVSEFQANVLDDNSVLLEYMLGNAESYLWVVTKNEVKVFTLPGRNEIESKVDRLTELVKARKPVAGESYQQMHERVAAADRLYSPAAHELSDMILGPAADIIRGKRLIVVTDGNLHYAPLSSLPSPNTASDEPILLSSDVVYQPSAQTLSVLIKGRESSSEPTRSRDLLVFSDPVFSRDDSRLTGVEAAPLAASMGLPNLRFAESLEGLQRLSASGAEAETISDIVGTSRTDVFTGFDARRDRLLAAPLTNYRIIHLATHGLVDLERPELSSVILSRFDERGQPIDEAVRPQDIYSMKLNADLVVLSACETGSGKEVRGEGVMALNTAFLQAGARSVVASLWQVEDNATNVMMREFYSGLANGQDVSSALRNAQIALYRDPQFRSPFYWAAFTLQGRMDTRPVSRQTAWPTWLAVATSGTLVLLSVFWFYRRRQVVGGKRVHDR